MTKTALAIRFLSFENLGVFEQVLRDRDYAVHYLDAGVDELDDDAVLKADLVVVLGGPIGANDGDRYPVVDDVTRILRRRIDRGLPIVGFCLGAQLIARALGAAVTPSTSQEIGYGPLQLTTEGQASVLRHLGSSPVLHWHNDRFEIPDGAVLLASTDRCPSQAFTYGEHVLALQFHLEVPRSDIERWLIGHAEALVTAGIHPDTIRAQAEEHGDNLEPIASRLLAEWLPGVR